MCIRDRRRPIHVPAAGSYGGRVAPGRGIVVVVVVVTGGGVGVVTCWNPEGIVRIDKNNPTPKTAAATIQGLIERPGVGGSGNDVERACSSGRSRSDSFERSSPRSGSTGG